MIKTSGGLTLEKKWYLTLESKVCPIQDCNKPFNKTPSFSSTPIVYVTMKLPESSVNEKLTEEEFDKLVAKLKEHYFSSEHADKIDSAWGFKL